MSERAAVNDVQSPLRLGVIGGGISGLSAALRLLDLARAAQRPVQITLFEGGERLGGVFGTERRGDYTIELGADSFITNKPEVLDLCRRLRIQHRLISTAKKHRGSLILHQGRPVPTPAGFNLMVPRQLAPILATPLLSAAGKTRFLEEQQVPPGDLAVEESVAEFVRRRYGSEVLNNLVQPLVGGIYTADPERLSLRATLPRFIEMEQQYGSLIQAGQASAEGGADEETASGARYGLFASFVDGMSELLSALEWELMGHIKLLRNTAVESVERVSGGSPTGEWRVRTSVGGSLELDGLVIATGHLVAARLLRNVDAPCARTLEQIESASSAIVITGHSHADISDPLDAFGLVIPHRERRRILAVSFLHRKFPDRAPAGKAILRTFVGGALQPEEFDQSDDELIATVRHELGELLGVRGDPEFAVVARYPLGMPQYTLGHLGRVARITERIAGIPQLELAGNAFSGVGLPDCVASGQQAAGRLWNSVDMNAR